MRANTFSGGKTSRLLHRADLASRLPERTSENATSAKPRKFCQVGSRQHGKTSQATDNKRCPASAKNPDSQSTGMAKPLGRRLVASHQLSALHFLELAADISYRPILLIRVANFSKNLYAALTGFAHAQDEWTLAGPPKQGARNDSETRQSTSASVFRFTVGSYQRGVARRLLGVILSCQSVR